VKLNQIQQAFWMRNVAEEQRITLPSSDFELSSLLRNSPLRINWKCFDTRRNDFYVLEHLWQLNHLTATRSKKYFNWLNRFFVSTMPIFLNSISIPHDQNCKKLLKSKKRHFLCHKEPTHTSPNAKLFRLKIMTPLLKTMVQIFQVDNKSLTLILRPLTLP
jgi:hypothetical protein